MDAAVFAVLGTYHERMREEELAVRDATPEALETTRDQRLLAIGPAAGLLISILVKSLRTPRILELGTAFGYSGVWLAEAARATGGHVVTVEVQDHKSRYAREMIASAGLADHVDFRVGDAVQVIGALSHGFDFVLVDLWRDLYCACLDAFYPKLNPGAIVVADNIISPNTAVAEMARYRRAVRAKPGMSSILLPVGAGLEVSRFEVEA